MIAGDALVRGGRLDVGAESEGEAIELVIRGEGPRVLLDPLLRDTLTKGVGKGPVEPRAAGAWLAHALGGGGRGDDPAVRPQRRAVADRCADFQARLTQR